MQDEFTMYNFMIAYLKVWLRSNMWEQPKQIKILFSNKLRDGSN